VGPRTGFDGYPMVAEGSAVAHQNQCGKPVARERKAWVERQAMILQVMRMTLVVREPDEALPLLRGQARL